MPATSSPILTSSEKEAKQDAVLDRRRKREEREEKERIRATQMWAAVAALTVVGCAASIIVIMWRRYYPEDWHNEPGAHQMHDRMPVWLLTCYGGGTGEFLYELWSGKKPSLSDVRGMARLHSFSAVFFAVLLTECYSEASVWLFKHMTGEHLCPRDDTEFYVWVGTFFWLVFMAYCSGQHADAYSSVHVKGQLNRVLKECFDNYEEDQKLAKKKE